MGIFSRISSSIHYHTHQAYRGLRDACSWIKNINIISRTPHLHSFFFKLFSLNTLIATMSLFSEQLLFPLINTYCDHFEVINKEALLSITQWEFTLLWTVPATCIATGLNIYFWSEIAAAIPVKANKPTRPLSIAESFRKGIDLGGSVFYRISLIPGLALQKQLIGLIPKIGGIFNTIHSCGIYAFYRISLG